MTKPNRGLGKGLDALLKGYNSEPKPGEVKHIPLDEIVANPNQPRKHFSESSLQELAGSISQQGDLQPVLVRPNLRGGGYELVAGERRLRASRIAGLATIPALVKELTDEESLAIALVENLQREDLNPIEEALGLQQLQKQFNLSQEALAQKIGKSRPAVANTMRLLQLPEEIQNDVRDNLISAGHARALLALHDDSIQQTIWKQIKEEGLSVREAERLVQDFRDHGVDPTNEQPIAQTRPKTQSGDEEMLPVLAQLVEALDLPVSIRGSANRGRIVITYSTSEEFHHILKQLGVHVAAN